MSRQEREPTNHNLPVVNQLREELRCFLGLSDLEIPDVVVSLTDDHKYAQSFPAQSVMGSDGHLIVKYHTGAVADIVRTYAVRDEEQEILSFIDRLYIGGGIILGTVSNRVRDADAESLTELFENFCDVHGLCEQIRGSNVDERSKVSLMAAMIRSSEARKVAIGLQRFCVGLLSYVKDETIVLERLEEEAVKDLIKVALAYDKLRTLHLGMGVETEDATLIADQWFTDAVTENTIALCFPMSIKEIKRVLLCCQAEPKSFDELVVYDEGEGKDGFTIEQAPETE